MCVPCNIDPPSSSFDIRSAVRFEFYPLVRKQKKFRPRNPRSKHITDDDEDEWAVIAGYGTNHQQAMDAYEIVDDIYRHAESFMHKSGMAMQPNYVGKPEDLYFWCLIRQSKTCWEYVGPMRYSCGCDTGIMIRITETKQTLMLER